MSSTDAEAVKIDWAHLQAHRTATDKPPSDWPQGVMPISQQGLALFGIHQRTGDIYWDGQRIETTIRLSNRDRLLAIIVAASTASLAIVDLLRYAWGE